MKQASFLDALKTVLAGFAGVRRRADHERAQIRPLHVVIAGVLCAALFVGTLVVIVRLVAG